MRQHGRMSLLLGFLLLTVIPCGARSMAILSGGMTFLPVTGLPADLAAVVTPQTAGYVTDNGLGFVDLAQYAPSIGATSEIDPEGGTVTLTVADRQLVFFTMSPTQFFDAHQGMTLGQVEAPPQPENPQRLIRIACTRVIDGDTIELANGEKVRYIGIDTPEIDAEDDVRKQLAKVAKQINRGMVEGRELVIEFGIEERDRYGRLLGYVYSGNVFVNAALVGGGYAQAATYPPNVKHADLFAALAAQAREANRGLWKVEQQQAQEEPPPQDVEPAAEPEQRTPPPTAGQVAVYITNTGDCYHRAGCSSLRKSKIAISLAAAKARGYRPCQRCNPPQ